MAHKESVGQLDCKASSFGCPGHLARVSWLTRLLLHWVIAAGKRVSKLWCVETAPYGCSHRDYSPLPYSGLESGSALCGDLPRFVECFLQRSF